MVTLAVTEALKAVGVGQARPLASTPMVNPSPGSVDASTSVKTATAAEDSQHFIFVGEDVNIKLQ